MLMPTICSYERVDYFYRKFNIMMFKWCYSDVNIYPVLSYYKRISIQLFDKKRDTRLNGTPQGPDPKYIRVMEMFYSHTGKAK